jgi:hypothetical protein
MGLNFTGRLPPEPAAPPAARPSLLLPVCLGLGALLAAAAVLVAGREHKAPPATPPLVGVVQPPHAPASPAPAPLAAVPASPSPPPVPPPVPAGPQPAPLRARMLQALRQAPGSVTLAVEDDAAAQAYARMLADLFREAGWRVEVRSVFGAGPPMIGLAAALGQGPSDMAIRRAFDHGGPPAFAPPPEGAGVILPPELFIGAPR